MDSRYKQRHGKEVEEEQNNGSDFGDFDGSYPSLTQKPTIPSPINNITEISNRSYNDLQDNGLNKIFESPEAAYVLNENGKQPISFKYTETIGESIGSIELGANIEADLIFISATYQGFSLLDGANNIIEVSEGLSKRVKNYGNVILFKTSGTYSGANIWRATGDLVKEYDITASADGTLWKTGQVDNSGNPLPPEAL